MRGGQSTRPREAQQPRASQRVLRQKRQQVRKERRAQGRNKTVVDSQQTNTHSGTSSSPTCSAKSHTPSTSSLVPSGADYMLFQLIRPDDESSRWESRMQQNEEAALFRGIVRGNHATSWTPNRLLVCLKLPLHQPRHRSGEHHRIRMDIQSQALSTAASSSDGRKHHGPAPSSCDSLGSQRRNF